MQGRKCAASADTPSLRRACLEHANPVNDAAEAVRLRRRESIGGGRADRAGSESLTCALPVDSRTVREAAHASRDPSRSRLAALIVSASRSPTPARSALRLSALAPHAYELAMADRLSELQAGARGSEPASPTESGATTPVRGTDHVVRLRSLPARADASQKGAIQAHQTLLRDPSIVRLARLVFRADQPSRVYPRLPVLLTAAARLSDKRAPRRSCSFRRCVCYRLRKCGFVGRVDARLTCRLPHSGS